ncbi:hypothetical protein MKX01_006453 [Papaver californicum]|nr:hypothetical protein MKX01_006453 [Papaver californicum]
MATRADTTSLLSNPPFCSSSRRTSQHKAGNAVTVFTVIRCSASLSTSNGFTDTTLGLKGKPWKIADARLVLEDGSVWNAKSFGASGTQVGEVLAQVILADPSYDEESQQCFLAGLVVRSLSMSTSNWRCTEHLSDYLDKRNIMGICKVLSTDASKTDKDLLEMSNNWNIVGVDLISGVSCNAPYEWVDRTGSEWEFNTAGGVGKRFHVVAYDFGIKHNILRRLASALKMKPDGVLFSNGPGDPSAVHYAVETVKEIIGKVPVFGICMGHQLLGQALGGKTFKMKFVHHGGNHPVRDIRKKRVEISAQNHNYAVDPASLPEGVEVTHINLNDGSCAGVAFPLFGEFMSFMELAKQKAE